MFLAVNILLWLVVAVLAFVAALHGRVLFEDGARNGALEFLRLLPRIGAGVIGSGFIAEILPKATVASWIGPDSGLFGVIAGGRLCHWLGGAQERGGRAAGDRLFHGLGALRHPSAGCLGGPADAAARRLVARGRLAAIAVHCGGTSDDAGAAVSTPGSKPH